MIGNSTFSEPFANENILTTTKQDANDLFSRFVIRRQTNDLFVFSEYSQTSVKRRGGRIHSL